MERLYAGQQRADNAIDARWTGSYGACRLPLLAAIAFALSGPLPPKEMGVILGVAVLLDAALVRLLLLPVMLRLLGRWAWYLPKPLDRLLPDVRFGHA